jgi:hypothetical protein
LPSNGSERNSNDGSDDFQRQILLELQEALYRLLLGFNMLSENAERKWAGESERKYAVLGDPGEMTQEAGPRVVMLVERVSDDQLPMLLNELHLGYGIAFPNTRSTSKAKELLVMIHRIQLRANKRIGELLRTL